jgi:hypothetical protein
MASSAHRTDRGLNIGIIENKQNEPAGTVQSGTRASVITSPIDPASITSASSPKPRLPRRTPTEIWKGIQTLYIGGADEPRPCIPAKVKIDYGSTAKNQVSDQFLQTKVSGECCSSHGTIFDAAQDLKWLPNATDKGFPQVTTFYVTKLEVGLDLILTWDEFNKVAKRRLTWRRLSFCKSAIIFKATFK